VSGDVDAVDARTQTKRRDPAPILIGRVAARFAGDVTQRRGHLVTGTRSISVEGRRAKVAELKDNINAMVQSLREGRPGGNHREADGSKTRTWAPHPGLIAGAKRGTFFFCTVAAVDHGKPSSTPLVGRPCTGGHVLHGRRRLRVNIWNRHASVIGTAAPRHGVRARTVGLVGQGGADQEADVVGPGTPPGLRADHCSQLGPRAAPVNLKSSLPIVVQRTRCSA